MQRKEKKSFVKTDLENRDRDTPSAYLAPPVTQPILDAITDGFMSVDYDGHLTYANKSLGLFLGVSRKQLIGKHAFEVFQESRGTIFEEKFRKAMDKRVTVFFETFYAPLKAWIECRCYPSPGGISVLCADKTQQKKGERERERLLAKLNRKASELEAVINTITDGLTIGDMDGNILTMNTAALKMHGFDKEDDFFPHLADYPDVFEFRTLDDSLVEVKDWPMARLMRGETFAKQELKILRKDTGRISICEYGGGLVMDTGGEPVLCIVTSQDIWERKQEEAHLLRFNKVLKGINRIFENAIPAKSKEAVGKVCLETALEVTGSKIGFVGIIGEDGMMHDIAVSDSGWDACRVNDKNGHRRPAANFVIHGIYASVLTEGKSFYTNDPDNHPARNGLPQGHPPITSFLGVPFKEYGKTVGMLAVANREAGYGPAQQEDLGSLAPAVIETLRRKKFENARKIAEASLRDKEALYRELVQHANSAIMRYGKDGTISFFNEYAQKLFGYHYKEVAGRHINIILPQSHTGGDLAGLVEDVIKFPESYKSYINQNVCKDGRRIWMNWANTVLYDDSGEVTEILCVGSDISQIKTMEEELRKSYEQMEDRVEERTRELGVANAKLKKSNQQLEELNAELREFAYVASHDLQEPLRKVRIFQDLLGTRSNGIIDEKSRDYLERIKTATSRMQKLLDSLLAYSRVTIKPVTVKNVDLAKSIEAALSNLEVMITETRGRIEVRDMPEILADRMQMIQLFQNLIANALKFTRPDQDPEITIYARPVEEDKVWEIHVADNGIGFEENYLEKIFLPFQRLHGKSQYPGTGMGLAICKKIVLRYGGEMSAKTKPGQGCDFIVTLPMAPPTKD